SGQSQTDFVATTVSDSGFLSYTLRPHMGRVEQSARRALLKPEERNVYFAEFAVDGLLRADSAGRKGPGAP
ncbi:MAG: hypothetical protein AABZ64_12790, partial [Nitrospinota bacterium]